MNSATQLTIVQQAAGVPAAIVRGNVSVLIPKVVRSMVRGSLIGDSGNQTEFTLTDFLVTVTQTGELARPRRGDTIICEYITYTVGHPDQNAPAVIDHGPDGLTWRIHTVRNP